jgi:hypothetical protein
MQNEILVSYNVHASFLYLSYSQTLSYPFFSLSQSKSRFPHGCCYTVMAILAAFGGVFMNMYVLMSCFFYNITELHPTTGEPLPSSKRGYGMMSRQISYGEEPSYMQCVFYPPEEIDELFDPWMNMAKTFAYFAAILAFVSMLVLMLACCCRFNKPTFERWLLWFYIWAAIFMLLTFFMYGGHFCKDNVCKVAEGSGYAISCFMFYLVTANTVKSMGQPPPDNMADDDDDDKGDHLWYNDDDERYGRRGGGNGRSRRRRGDDDDENGSFFVNQEAQRDDDDDDDQFDDGDERDGRKHRNKRNDDDDDDSDDDDDDGDEDAFEDFDDEFDDDDDNNNRNTKNRSSVSGSRAGNSRGGDSRGGIGSRMGNSRQSNGMLPSARSSARSARISEEMSEGGWEDASDSYDTNSATEKSGELYGSNNMSGQQALSGNNAPFDGQTRRQNQFGEPVDEYGVTRPKQEKDAALHSGTYKPPASRKAQQYQLPPPQYRQQEQQQQPTRSATGGSGNVQMTQLGAGQQDEQAFDNDSFFGGSRASNMTGRRSRATQQQQQQQQDPPARSGQWS